MTAPSFLNTGFAFTALPGSTVDVADIVTAVTTMLTSTLSATPTSVYPSGERWTNLGGGVFKSPVDAGGRFCKITIIRVSALVLTFNIDDPTGLMWSGRIQIAGAGSVVNIYGGPGHIFIEANNAGTWEVCCAVLSDPTPEPLAAYVVYVWCRTSRDGASTLIANNGNLDWWGGRLMAGATIQSSGGFLKVGCRPTMKAQDSSNTKLLTQAGSDVAAPMYISDMNTANVDPMYNCGKLYQCVTIDSNQVKGTDLNIPIDTGVTGVFRVINLTSGGAVGIAVRKG